MVLHDRKDALSIRSVQTKLLIFNDDARRLERFLAHNRPESRLASGPDRQQKLYLFAIHSERSGDHAGIISSRQHNDRPKSRKNLALNFREAAIVPIKACVKPRGFV
jgi:hypothetical protein